MSGQLFGREVGYVSTCGFEVGAALCAAPAVIHVAVPENENAVATIDGTYDTTLIDLDHCVMLMACIDHVTDIEANFRWRVPHPVGSYCTSPEATFTEPRCVINDDTPTLTAEAALAVPAAAFRAVNAQEVGA